MKHVLTLGLVLLVLILTGCSTEVTKYRQQQPAPGTFHYFREQTKAWEMMQDHSGRQLRRFHAKADDDVVSDTLTLHERSVYDGGEEQQRMQRIRRIDGNHYQGITEGIEDMASGRTVGNVFH